MTRTLAIIGVAMLTCAAAPGLQQVPTHQQKPARGVVVPDRGVDPGMRVIAPKMPAQSTPVIHPGATAQDGTVVVPK